MFMKCFAKLPLMAITTVMVWCQSLLVYR